MTAINSPPSKETSKIFICEFAFRMVKEKRAFCPQHARFYCVTIPGYFPASFFLETFALTRYGSETIFVSVLYRAQPFIAGKLSRYNSPLILYYVKESGKRRSRTCTVNSVQVLFLFFTEVKPW